jgi:DASS family divalent anion:Na+ symporter
MASEPARSAARTAVVRPTLVDSRPPTRVLRLAAPVVIYLLIVYVLQRPARIDPQGWRITGLFLATIVGFVLQPLPVAVLVIIALGLLVFIGNVAMTKALGGFSSPLVWLVLTAMLMSRALKDTGLSRRIALLFIRRFGGSSLGVSYSLILSDVVLAAGIPSITARSGGIILPIARSIAELYESRPGPSARVLGSFLMVALYQGSAVACAMFFTGQVSNVLAAGLAAKLAGVTVTWTTWFVAGIVPGLVSCAVVPCVIYRLLPPDLKRTPAAAEFARAELLAMGRLRGREAVALLVLMAVCGLWITSAWHGLDVTAVALGGIGALFLFNVLTWETALAERAAWDVFVWYGGIFTMGELLNQTGATTVFATWVGSWFTRVPWSVVLLATLAIYFYAHYAFVSITAHVVSMFPPFLVMLIKLGTPPGLAVYSLACLANLTAGLTHYGTTTGPIVFATNYVSLGDWWRVGLLISFVNLAIWLTIGFAWWKFLGVW